MCPRIIIKLPDVPKHLKLEYHPDQVALYSKFTELTFNALALPSVNEFLENLSSILGLEKIEVLVMRLPARRSKIEFVKEEGKTHMVWEELHGAALKKYDLILIWPDLLWPNKKAKPFWCIGIRGATLNSTIKAAIHEMLHKSGIADEEEVRKLTDQHYKNFRCIYLSRFEAEFKPLLNQWKKTEKEMGTR
jgi:hypothetical protein